MTIRRYEISDFEWAIILPLLPNKPHGVARVDDRKVLNGHLLATANRLALGRHSGAVWPLDDLLQPLCALAEAGRVGRYFRCCFKGLRRQSPDGRRLLDPGSTARCQR